MGRDSFHQTRVLRAPYSLALDTAREGAATASLGSLGQGLTTRTGKSFFLRSSLNLQRYRDNNSPNSLEGEKSVLKNFMKLT